MKHVIGQCLENYRKMEKIVCEILQNIIELTEKAKCDRLS